MRFLFSLLTFFIVGFIVGDSYAMPDDFDESRKNAPLIFPKGFQEDPIIAMDKKLLRTILSPGKVFNENGVYKARLIQGNDIFLYKSTALHMLSQLDSILPITFQLHTIEPERQDAPIIYKQWRFTVTVIKVEKKEKKESHSFSIYLFPYDEMLKLSDEEKKRFECKILAKEEVSKNRLPPMPEPQELAKHMIETMYHDKPLRRPDSSSEFLENPKEKIPERPKEVKTTPLTTSSSSEPGENKKASKQLPTEDKIASLSSSQFLESAIEAPIGSFSQLTKDNAVRKTASWGNVLTLKNSEQSPPVEKKQEVREFKKRQQEWRKAGHRQDWKHAQVTTPPPGGNEMANETKENDS